MTDERVATSFEIREILDFLPHRYPFLLVDRILDIEPGERIVGIKNVSINEPFFQGHFPGVPIMPGVLIIEAMAQAGGILVFYSLAERKKKLVFLAGLEKARFRKPVVPGDQIRIEMEVLRVKSRVGRLKGAAKVNGQTVAETEMLFSLVDRPSDPSEAL